MTPLDDVLKFDPDQPRLARARRHMFYLGRDGVETYTASSDRVISDLELYSPANNSTVRDIRSAADRAVMLWECVIRDAREGRA
jgi:hypothetical protein